MLFIRNRILNHLNLDKRSNLHLVSLKIDLTFTILTNISQKNSLFLHSVLLIYLTYNTACIGEGNGNPLQCSCLENLRDGEAWWLPSIGSHRVGHDWSDLAAATAGALCICSFSGFKVPNLWIQPSLGGRNGNKYVYMWTITNLCY